MHQQPQAQYSVGGVRVLCKRPCHDRDGHYWIENGTVFEGRRMFRCDRENCAGTTFEARPWES